MSSVSPALIFLHKEIYLHILLISSDSSSSSGITKRQQATANLTSSLLTTRQLNKASSLPFLFKNSETLSK